MSFASVGDEDFYYEIAGSGPALLLVTGLAGVASYWDINMPALTRHFTVIRYDHRGTGQSVRTEGAYSIEALTDDLVGLLDALGLEQVMLLGHSTGGAIGQVLAARHPARVERMVLYASWASLCPQMALCMELRLQLLRAYGPEAYHRASPVFLYPPRHVCDAWPQLEETLVSATENSTTAPILEARVHAVTSFDGLPYLADITCPTLVLVARDDILTPPASSEVLAQHIPNATLQLLPYGAHAVSQCDPETFQTALISFLMQ